MEHHADFAVPVTQRLWLTTKVERRNGSGLIAGWAISLGWWVGPNVNEDGTPGEATGVLYLIVDEADPGAPVWIAEGKITSCRLAGMDA